MGPLVGADELRIRPKPLLQHAHRPPPLEVGHGPAYVRIGQPVQGGEGSQLRPGPCAAPFRPPVEGVGSQGDGAAPQGRPAGHSHEVGGEVPQLILHLGRDPLPFPGILVHIGALGRGWGGDAGGGGAFEGGAGAAWAGRERGREAGGRRGAEGRRQQQQGRPPAAHGEMEMAMAMAMAMEVPGRGEKEK